MNELICPICGKLRWQGTGWQAGHVTVTFILSGNTSATQEYCYGHSQPIAMPCSLNTPPPVKVPQAFYDAFSDEEVQP